MNKVILVGNLTRDPETKQVGSGVTLCTFGVAVNRTYVGADGERKADFFDVITWRGLADNCAKYLTKGRQVAVSGRLESRTYETQDGSKRYAIDIVADDVEFLRGGMDSGGDRGGDRGDRGGDRQQKQKISDLRPLEDNDLPF